MSVNYYLQVIFTLTLLAGVLYFMHRFTNKIQKKKYRGDIKVIDRLPVDNNATLLIIEVKNQEYLLSVSGKEIKVIEKL